jgi:beta-lactam-binding protein with PASTA domain
MSASRPFTCRPIRSSKRWAVATLIAMVVSSVSPGIVSTVQAQAPAPPLPVVPASPAGAGFILDAGDLRFIFHAIEVAQAHAAGGTLLGPGPNQVQLNGHPEPQLPLGLRTVDGSFNNLVPVPDQHLFGTSDQFFPRLTTPQWRTAEQGTTYNTTANVDVIDSQPRVISNLIVDQSAANPAAAAAASNVCGGGGFVCSGAGTTDPGVTGASFPASFDTGSIEIPNTTPDFGLSAPFNLMFVFFGQFFDHGLDLVDKGGNGTVVMPLKTDDPLFRSGVDPSFNQMTMDRASVDANHNSVNQTTPWVDQNQTYTSHPSHQVFLRQYACAVNPSSATCGGAAGVPLQDGRMLDGGFCASRGTGFADDNICNVGNWGQVKAQAAKKLGIQLTDNDLLNVPLLLTDPYGHFKPGPHGFPQIKLPGNVLLEGDPTANAGLGVLVPVNALKTNHQFLNDIAHSAVPTYVTPPTATTLGVLNPDPDTTVGSSLATPVCAIAGCYDNELLDQHFVTGDGRGNENIGLSTMHTLFHSEHNRLRSYIDNLINQPAIPAVLTPIEIANCSSAICGAGNASGLTQAEIDAWHRTDPASGWTYGERLFQASRFVTEMEYQHIVFEQFARKIQPLITPFLGYITSIDGAISAEFAHTVYRLGHSMLPEVITRINADGSTNDKRLFEAFLNPLAFNDGGSAGPLSAAAAAGSIVRGITVTVGNELDEFVVNSVRNTLVGLPLDLPAINIARGRSEGIPSLNNARKQFFTATRNSAVTPYSNWFEFGQNLRHQESLVNFVAAYGTDPSITGATTIVDKRAAAAALVAANGAFMFQPAATSGVDVVDFWPGGMAERQSPFGGLLGSTFNFVFEKQLNNLQNGDRFYYLSRLDGLNLRNQIENNTLAELARRNTDVGGVMANVFNLADHNFNVGVPGDPTSSTTTVTLADGTQLQTRPDGTKVFFDAAHKGRNVMFNGSAGDDRLVGDIGDDTFWGNLGNDRIDGGDGNDAIFGGPGDDVLFGGFGDDTLDGGPGNDALSSGPGFGGDILLGGEGNDFLVGGDDGVEYFAGPGDDIIVDGQARAEAIFGGPGDDWLEAGDGHDGGMFGDNGNVQDLLAGLDPNGGDDVLDGGPGQDNHFGEGGDDIFLMNEGSNKFFGDYGFDWATQRGWPAPASMDLDLAILPNAPINFNDTRDVYRFVDGASGWDLNDFIRGSHSNVLCNPPIEVVECLLPGMELTAGTPPVHVPAVGADRFPVLANPALFNIRGGSGAAKIAGLTALMGIFNVSGNANLSDPAIPNIKNIGFMGGNIMLGGRGSDKIETNAGNDLIDGDLWLNVQLRALMNDGTVKLVDHATDLIADVFSDPQRLNPGNISIVRTIITPGFQGDPTGALNDPNPAPAPAPDCNAAVPLNCDTVVFHGNRADYDITTNANGTVTVVDTGRTLGRPLSDGIDTLRNIERLQFADGTIPVPAPRRTVTVPNVVGLTAADATTAITNAQLVLGDTGEAFSQTIPIGNVVSQTPDGGSIADVNTRVAINVSPGAAVPDVTGLTQAAATAALTNALLGVSVTTARSTTVAIGTVISQNPTAFSIPGAPTQGVAPGSTVALVVSSGTVVPNVVGQTQANATTAIIGAGLIVGTITNQPGGTAGNVLSETPGSGTVAAPGSAVNLVVATAAPPVAGPTVRINSQGASSLTTPTLSTAANSLLVAFIAADANPAGPNTTVTAVSNSGVNLVWTKAAGTIATSPLGMAEIWWAYSPSALVLTQVTATLSSSKASTMTVQSFTGAEPSLVGEATAIRSLVNATPSASLVTTRSNSLVWAVGVDFSNGRTMNPGANQTKVSQFVPNVNDTYWLQRATNPIANSGTTVTINDTNIGGADQWSLVLIEIRRQ